MKIKVFVNLFKITIMFYDYKRSYVDEDENERNARNKRMEKVDIFVDEASDAEDSLDETVGLLFLLLLL